MREFSGSPRCARIYELIQLASTIAICGHTSPDGDALGSALGLGLALRELFPEKRVSLLLADDDPVPAAYRFMPGSELFEPASAYEGDPDLFIMVDAPTPDRIANGRAVFERARTTAVFDHHPADHEEADAVVRDVEAAACSAIIERFLDACRIPLTYETATCLLCGIETDTGRFQYQNTTADTFRSAAALVDAGASPAEVSLNVYQSWRLEYLHLQAIVMGRIERIVDGKVAYSYAYASDLESCGVQVDECDGLVDIVRSVGGVEACLFLREKADGTVRGNLRAKGDLDVSQVARKLGGGGHVAAAGFTFTGTIEEARAAAEPLLKEILG